MRNFFDESYESGDRDKLAGGIMTDKHKTIIGVKGVGHGAGATFIAMNLAFQMAEMQEGITFVSGKEREEGKQDAAHLLAVDSRYRKQSGRRPANMYKKVNWLTEAQEIWSQHYEYRHIPGKFIVVDDPDNMEDLDIVVAIVDPLPSRIEAGIDTYTMLRELDIPVIWVLNKNNGHAGVRATEKFLRIKFDFYVEMLPAEIFYKAEYDCTQVFFIRKPHPIQKVAERVLTHNN